MDGLDGWDGWIDGGVLVLGVGGWGLRADVV